jgi:hypothetical protein
MGQMGVLEVEATGFQAPEQGFNGLITNDKFCLIRTGRLALSWWHRPLRLRGPGRLFGSPVRRTSRPSSDLDRVTARS